LKHLNLNDWNLILADNTMIGMKPIALWLAGQKYYVFEISGTKYKLSRIR